MDEITEVIQDARYLGATASGMFPQPTVALRPPTYDEAKELIEGDPTTLSAGEWSFSGILGRPLGEYFFRCFLKRHGEMDKFRFLKDVTLLKRSSNGRTRKRLAIRIRHSYLVPRSTSQRSFLGPERVHPSAEGQLLDKIPISPCTMPRKALSGPRAVVVKNDSKSESKSSGDASVHDKRSSFVSIQCRNSFSSVSTSTSTNSKGSTKAAGGARHDALPSESVTSESRRRAPKLVMISRRIKSRVSSPPIEFFSQDSLEIACLQPWADSCLSMEDVNANKIGISGILLDDLISFFDDWQNSCGDPSKPAVPPVNLFDELALAVVLILKKKYFASFIDSSFFRRMVQYVAMAARPIGQSSFTSLRMLGRGGFGAVNGCQKDDTGAVYAVKVIDKRRVKMKGAEDLVWNERDLLRQINSPFVISLRYAFQNEHELFLVTDIMTGGDLKFHLMQEKQFEEDRARLYAAEIILGLEHLHSIGYVYRDVKPENILLDRFGHCCITDLGLAASMSTSLKGRCGTQGYWAPEMLLRDPEGHRLCYGPEVDFWSLGCLIYEMLVGVCPFRSAEARALHSDRRVAFDKATLGMVVTFPKHLSQDACNIISGLLTRNPTDRLGSHSADEIKRHPWFRHLDWGMVEAKEIVPIWTPDEEVNALTQDVIGDFKEPTKIFLSKEDQREYSRSWDCVVEDAFERELIEHMMWEEVRESVGPLKERQAECCVLV